MPASRADCQCCSPPPRVPEVHTSSDSWCSCGPQPTLASPAAGRRAPTPTAPPTPKVLRYAFPVAETGFDPAQVTDLYSNTVLANIFEAPLEYEYLARAGTGMRANTAAACPRSRPTSSAFVFRIKPGIHFADDPAFKGAPRELIARRTTSTRSSATTTRAGRAASSTSWRAAKILGLSELRAEAIAQKKRLRLRPRGGGPARARPLHVSRCASASRAALLRNLTDPDLVGAVAREVVEFYGDKITEHPVGTGPFRLDAWRRSSRMVLERNPGYRESVLRRAPAGRTTRAAWPSPRRLNGKRLPMIDRVEVADHRGAAAALAVVPERRART